MSDLTHVSSASSAGPQKANTSSKGSGSKQDASDEPSNFNSMYDNYVESEQKQSTSAQTSVEQTSNKSTSVESENLPQQGMEDGNALPPEDMAAMWQALMLLQPTATAASNTSQQQTDLLLGQQKNSLQQPLVENMLNSNVDKMALLDKSPTSRLNASLLEQDYYQTMLMQKQSEAGTLASGNVSTQLAAMHLSPERNDALLLNMNEQLMPTQSVTSNMQTGLGSVGLAGTAQAAITQSYQAPLNLGQNAWENNLGSRLQMMVGQNVQTAEIRLDPPELGSLDIKIKVSNDIASINIASPHSQVRDALESAIPRLREMLEESGLSLGDVNVSQESFSEQQQASEGETGASPSNLLADEELNNDPTLLTRNIESNGLLDIYA